MSYGSVWIAYEPSRDCQCWRDALCSHGWTWQPIDYSCHREASYAAHESLADAVRDLFSIRGAEALGPLLRERYRPAHRTMTVYVMPPGFDEVDDHQGAGGPVPLYVIERTWLMHRSTPRNDFDHQREMAGQYRPTAAPTADHD